MAVALPRDDNRVSVQITPPSIALARTVNPTLSTSQTITFNASTTFLRIYAYATDVYFKWGATAVTASNFDEVIPAGQIVDLFVPRDSTGVLYTTCRVIERVASATIILIEK